VIGETGDPPAQAGIPVQCRYGKLRLRSKTSPNTNYFCLSRAGQKSLCLHLSLYLKAPKILLGRIFFVSKFTMKNKKIKIILLSAIILIFLGLFFFIPHKTVAPNNTQTTPVNQNNTPLLNLPLNKEEGQAITTTLQTNGVSYTDTITGKMSVYDFMSQLRNEGKINFTEENYIGMGEFIKSINGIENNNSLVWIYYVNGTEAQIGISNYKINPGDVVSWKYEKSEY
jgi:hypothetical protein